MNTCLVLVGVLELVMSLGRTHGGAGAAGDPATAEHPIMVKNKSFQRRFSQPAIHGWFVFISAWIHHSNHSPALTYCCSIRTFVCTHSTRLAGEGTLSLIHLCRDMPEPFFFSRTIIYLLIYLLNYYQTKYARDRSGTIRNAVESTLPSHS